MPHLLAHEFGHLLGSLHDGDGGRWETVYLHHHHHFFGRFYLFSAKVQYILLYVGISFSINQAFVYAILDPVCYETQ